MATLVRLSLFTQYVGTLQFCFNNFQLKLFETSKYFDSEKRKEENNFLALATGGEEMHSEHLGKITSSIKTGG